jgi:HAD superfamily hydrolase (TIGR01549 family)
VPAEPVEAVFFDLYGTLAYWARSLETTVRQVADRYGVELDWSAYGAARERLDQMAWEVLQHSHALFSCTDMALCDDVLPSLRRLQERGLILAVVSNFHTPLDNILEELGIRGFFTAVIASHDQRVQAAKPDPAIFRPALAVCGAAPERTIYVGDSFRFDVLGAQAAGIRPVLIVREGSAPDWDGHVVRSLLELPALIDAMSDSAEG